LYFWHLFFLFYRSMVFTKIVKFLCCFIVWIQDFINKFCKTMFCLSKKIEIFEIQNFNKISSFTIFFIFLAFLAFCFLFHLSKLIQKWWNLLWCFIGRIRDFTSDFWKILKVLLKNYWYVKYFFVKIPLFTICFFIFVLYLTLYFQFRLTVLVNKF